MSQETSFSIAFKEAVKTMSKKQQVKLITDHFYGSYEVFKKFKPLAIGIDDEITKAMPQYDSHLVLRALSSHCRRPKYIDRLTKGGKRFSLNGKVNGEVTEEEMKAAKKAWEELNQLLDEKTKAKRSNMDKNAQNAAKKKEAGSKADKGEAHKSEVDKTEVGKTEADKAEVGKAAAHNTDADKAAAHKTEVGKTDADTIEAGKTEVEKSEADKTETDKTDVKLAMDEIKDDARVVDDGTPGSNEGPTPESA